MGSSPAIGTLYKSSDGPKFRRTLFSLSHRYVLQYAKNPGAEVLAQVDAQGSLVGTKHLDAYLEELEHRFNNRKNEYIFRDTLTQLVTAMKLPYSELIKTA